MPAAAFRLVLAAAVVSGAAALVYEVVWLRMLGLVVGHAVDALAGVLAAFMAGLAIGAALFGRLAGRVRRRRSPARGVGCLRRGAPAEALAQFDRALALDPAHTASALGASTAALQLGRPAEALAFARRALAREPAQPTALFMAGAARGGSVRP